MSNPQDVEPIAIIGIGCRMPGNVGSAEDMWRLVSTGGSGWKTVPADRWNADAFYHPDKGARQSYNTKTGYFIDQDISHYDSRFFGFSSVEANSTDPQQRILLETTYEALENAGIPMESLKGTDTAVFAALFARDYDRMGYKDLDTLSGMHIGGAGEAIIANRISHFLDIRGTSMTIDTGCSGSLVALHEACICLRSGQSRMAIVGGTEILVHPDQNIAMSVAGMLNDDGKCYTFDSRGAGYGRGEGVGTVIVKRLSDALADGDTVHAVVRVSGSNQDGKTNGITNPSPESQEALMKQVYANVGLDPHDTLYVEAHGTGTVAGDHAEAQSLSSVFCQKKRAHKLPVGSVKTNMGHLEAASGMAGLIKSIMVLKHKQVPPNLNFIEPKEGLMLDERQLEVPLELKPLIPEGEAGAVRVSLNSFGYGGTNCHVILESLEQFLSSESRFVPKTLTNGSKPNGVNGVNGANGTNGIHKTNGTDGVNGTNGHAETEPAHTVPEKLPLIFPISANSEATLEAMPAQLNKWLADNNTEADLRKLSYTLTSRRSLLKWRKAFVANDLEQLQSLLNEPKISKTRAAGASNVAFVFTGQGAQWAGMGRDLVSTSEVFRKAIETSSEVLKSLGCEWDLLEELSKSGETSRINESELAQPLTTIVQMAIVDLLASVGVKPKFVVGHSSGEIAAAYAAGALSHANAIKGSFFRGRYSKVAKKLNAMPGSMLATGYSEQAALASIKAANLGEDKGRVVVACVNSPASVTLSGDEPAIDAIKEMISNVGIFTRKLVVESAYHSHHMEKVADAYKESIGDLAASDVNDDVEFLSSVTGEAKKTGFGSDYWVENLVSKVRFNDAVNSLAQRMTETGALDADNIFIEIGPHSALQGPVKQILSAIPGFKHSYVAPLQRGKDSSETFMAAGGRLFELGAEPKWNGLFTATDKVVIPDLLPYPWDHRVKHWVESRLSRAHRLRKYPYHDLLGLYDPMSPIHEPRWRFYVSVYRQPWLRDHVVDNIVIWPGAGYTTMATEAMKQLTDMQHPGAKINRFILRNIRITRPIALHEEAVNGDEEVEVQLVLSPSKMDQNTPWYSIRCLSLQKDGSWADHISGSIRVELESEANGVNSFGQEHMAAEEEARAVLKRVQARATEQMDMKKFYEDSWAAGNQWGPCFSLLEEGWIGKGCALAKMRLPDIAKWMPGGHFEPHTIHPTTLDASNHMMSAIFQRDVVNSPVMPFTTDESIITKHTSSKPGLEFVVATELTPEGKIAAKCDAWAYQPDENGELQPVSSVRGLVLRAVGEDASKTQSKLFERKHNYQIFWKDDPDFLTKESYDAIVSPLVARGPAVMEKLDANETAAAIYLDYVKDHPVVVNPESAAIPHLVKYGRWIQDYVKSDACKELVGHLTEDEKKVILERSRNADSEGEGLSQIGKNLSIILNNEINALELLVVGNVLEKMYAQGAAKPLMHQMNEFVGLLSNKNPQMDILEIGAGTGSATVPLFHYLGADAHDKIHKYHYTDIATSFFEDAREHLKDWSHLLEYKTLDVSKDPAEQGYDPAQHQFDLIVASNVIHATKSINETLTNVRKLLKPGGRLILIEVKHGASRSLPLIFGTLPGWWEFEDGREDSPLLSHEGWNRELREAGYGGIEFASPECDSEKHRISLIISKAVEQGPVDLGFTPPVDVQVITNAASKMGKLTSSALAAVFNEAGMTTGETTWEDLPVLKEEDTKTLHIVLDCANYSILAKPDAEAFARYQSLLVHGRNVMWIMFHEADDQREEAALVPFQALVNGMARTVRHESETLKMLTIEYRNLLTEDKTSTLAKDVKRISKILLETNHESTVEDEEFQLEGSRLLIPRAYADKQFNNWTDRLFGRSALVPTDFKNAELPLRMEVGSPGLLSSLHFVQDEAPAIPLEPEQIRIESKAYGVNFRDVFTALGQMGSSSLYMGECAGVVTEVGSGEFAQSTYKVGDRVMGIFSSPFASQGTMSAYDCHVLPDNVSFVEGASIHIVYATVYYCFVNIARLEPGSSVLIHSGTGGVGQAALQLARHLGCSDDDIFITVGNEDKKKFLMDEYNVPESRILSSRSTPMDLRRRLMLMTNNKGVDVVLNSTTGEMLSESWECVAPFGFHIELGKADIERRRHISMGPFTRNVTFSSVDMTIVSKQKPKVLYNVLDKVMDLFARGILTAVRPLNAYPIEQLESAFRLISERKHLGKVVMDLTDDKAKVQAVLPPPRLMQLDKEGTYIIAGGLGDIGRMLCKFLSKSGAGHIITLSRRVLPDEERIAFQNEIESYGGKVHLQQCDITSRESVEKVRQYCKDNLPPVKGIIHGGMVLQDRPFVAMNHEEWNFVLGPKVFGTINLDETFRSTDLEFFIALSSISVAIGNPGQGNYVAANAFQDAYIASRPTTNGTRYVTLNLPIVGETRAVTHATGQHHDFAHRGGIPFDPEEIPPLVSYAMDKSIDIGRDFWHSVMGFDRESISKGSGQFKLSSVYRTIPAIQSAEGGEGGQGGGKRDVESILRACETFEDAVQVIAEATHEKFIAFLNLDSDDITMTQPLSSIGLDSLVSIELKNWLVRSFKVTLQASELSNAPSILHLAETLAGRSKILPANLARKAPGDGHDEPKGEGFQDGPAFEEQQANGVPVADKLGCCPDPTRPLFQPLPDLREAMDDVVKSMEFLDKDEDEMESLRASMAKLTAPGGVGERVYNTIKEDAKDPKKGNWIGNFITDDYYMYMRQPLQYTSFMALNHHSPVPHTQAERAALVTMEAWKLKRQIDTDTVGTVMMVDTPICKSQMEFLYNTYRKPAIGKDELIKAPSDYCGVLRRGRFFMVPLLDATFEQVRAAMAAIISHVDDEGTWAGILTSDNRDSWAKYREELLAVSPANAKYFQALEAAAFIVNLDDNSPVGYTEHAKAGMLGDGSNRWYDKGLQFVVTANGHSGLISEHSHIDGTTPGPLYDSIEHAVMSYKPTPLAEEGPVPEELTLTLSPEIEAHVQVLRERQNEAVAIRDYVSHSLPDFTPHLLGDNGVSVKAGYDLLAQLAIFLYFDRRILPNWQPVMHLQFHKGRHDVAQMMTVTVRKFLEAAIDPKVDALKKRALLLEACKDINANIRKTRYGQGFFRLLTVLQSRWPKDEPKAELFDTEMYNKWYDFTAMFNINHATTETITTPLQADTLRLRYSIQDTQSVISLNCPVGGADKFVRSLDEAAAIIRELCLTK